MLQRISICILLVCCLSTEAQSINIPQRGAQQSGSQAPNLLYQVYGLAEKTLSLRDITAKAFGAALIADALWQDDEPYARQLFEKALALTTASNAEEQNSLSHLRQNVLALIAKHDAGWAKRLIDGSNVNSNQSPSQRREANLEVARGLIRSRPDAAIDFAMRSLREGVSETFVWFLKELQRSNQDAANKLFLQSLALLARQPKVDVEQFALLGTYIFTSPKVDGRDLTNFVITRVGDIGIIDITAERPGTPSSLIRAYLESATEVLKRAVSNPDQQQASYALAYLLLPKAQKHAPDLVALISATMSTLSASVPTNITQDSAYANLNKAGFDSVEEMISRAEKLVGVENRDVAFLDIAFNVWLQGDFKTARAVTTKITDLQASARLTVLNDFGEGAWLLKKNAVPLTEVEGFANRLPQGIERAVLLLGLANASLRSRDTFKAKEAIEQSLKSISGVNDARRPFLILFAASQMASVDRIEAQSLLADAVKEFNKQDDSAIAEIDWRQPLEIGPLVEKFPLDVYGLEFSFGRAFRRAIVGNIDGGINLAESLKNERLRVRACVELVRAIIENSRKIEQSKEPVVRVGEDGMRNSASRIVMPTYPEADRKSGYKGVVVIEVQYNGKGIVTQTAILETPSQGIGEAVTSAVRQWKFKPSTLKGEPISVRGKLTFYFCLDEDGKGRVENPKQFQ